MRVYSVYKILIIFIVIKYLNMTYCCQINNGIIYSRKISIELELEFEFGFKI